MSNRHLNRLSTLSAVLMAVPATLTVWSCAQEDSQLAPEETSPAPNPTSSPAAGYSAPGARTAHRYFNGGYGGTYKSASGDRTGPRFTKGHTWITKKAIDFLSKRGLLPPQMQSEINQNYLYFGTAFADWQWLGRPENPDAPVPSPVTANLDAYAALRSTTSNCPYSPSCSVAPQLKDTQFADKQLDPNKIPLQPIAAGNCSDQYSKVTLTQGVSGCADNKWHFSDDGDASGTLADLIPSNSNCLKASPVANFQDKNIERTTHATISLTGDLYMKVSGVYGLGNGTRNYATGDFDYGMHLEHVSTFDVCLADGNYDGRPWTFLEDRVPLHGNPVMLFTGSLMIGGGDTWLDWLSSDAALQWGNPVNQDFALDNLYHYSLGDISLYSGLGKTPAAPRSSDSGIAACSGYLGGRIYYNTDAYYACEAACCSTIIGCFTGCGCDYLKDSEPGWEDDNKWAQYEQCLLKADPLPTEVVLYPLLFNDYVTLSSTAQDHPFILKDALLQLQFQPVIRKVSYGAPKYGSVLYQLSRKFFRGSPASPSLNELIRAGNDLPADSQGNVWRTGGMYGTKSIYGSADFSTASVDFPHTYLGGNPFICSGGSRITDTCADGRPTWPTWVPDRLDGTDQASQQAFLDKLSSATPGQSDRAALIYLGWTSHLMQDLALPHHASNWSSTQHANQDSIGDYFAVADTRAYNPDKLPVDDDGVNKILAELDRDISIFGATIHLPDAKTLLDAFYNQIDAELDAKFAAFGGPNPSSMRLADYCNSVHLSRDAITTGSLNWSAVLPAFLTQGARAAAARRSQWTNLSRYDLVDSYSTSIMKNAIEQTVDLLLCAAPPICTSNCSQGTACSSNGQCASGVCQNGTCQAPTCLPNCGAGTACTANADCASKNCAAGVCKAPPCAPNCSEGTKCGQASDCASGVCTANVCAKPSCQSNCGQGVACANNWNCASGVCANGVCQPPGCSPQCNRGAGCGSNTDCGSQVCAGGTCQAPVCGPMCSEGAVCGDNGDCASRVCLSNRCRPPSCSPQCNQGATCGASGDCGSRVCKGGLCQAPACAPSCSKGAACNNNGDCASHVCNNGACQ